MKYPLNQFRLIRRFDQNWPKINRKSVEVIENLEEFDNFVTIENHELLGAADALVRLSNVYQLDLTEHTTSIEGSGQ